MVAGGREEVRVGAVVRCPRSTGLLFAGALSRASSDARRDGGALGWPSSGELALRGGAAPAASVHVCSPLLLLSPLSALLAHHTHKPSPSPAPVPHPQPWTLSSASARHGGPAGGGAAAGPAQPADQGRRCMGGLLLSRLGGSAGLAGSPPLRRPLTAAPPLMCLQRPAPCPARRGPASAPPLTRCQRARWWTRRPSE